MATKLLLTPVSESPQLYIDKKGKHWIKIGSPSLNSVTGEYGGDSYTTYCQVFLLPDKHIRLTGSSIVTTLNSVKCVDLNTVIIDETGDKS